MPVPSEVTLEGSAYFNGFEQRHLKNPQSAESKAGLGHQLTHSWTACFRPEGPFWEWNSPLIIS